MRTIFCVWLLFSIAVAEVRAGEMMRQVQEELRKRNLYFGEIDGNTSESLQKAVMKYQQVKGFSPNGLADANTLRSLGVDASQAEVPEMIPLPDVVVLKSDAPRELTEEDRRLAEQTNVGEIMAPGEGPVETDPELLTVSTGPATPMPASSSSQDAIPNSEVEAFVQDYLQVCESNNLDAELAHYGDAVDYFDHGRRQQDFIRKDVQSYYRRWPVRDYELEDLQVAPGPNEDEKIARFHLRFKVSNGATSASGITRNVFKVRREGDSLKFVAMKEQRLRK